MGQRALSIVGGVALTMLAASCAFVGYDLDGYGPASGGGTSTSNGAGGTGGATSSSGRASSSASSGGGGTDPCGPDGVCVEPAPAGWLGPVALYEGSAMQACAAPYPSAAWSGGRMPTGAAATCSTCTCDKAPCSAGFTIISDYSDSTCTTVTHQYAFPGSMGNCDPVSPVSLTHVEMLGPMTSGACGASQVQTSVTPPSFAELAIACDGGAPKGSCGAGRSCFPAPAPPFEAELCIYKEGAASCPAGTTQKPALFASIDDTRTCSDCACGAAAARCSGTAILYSDMACTAPLANVSTPPACDVLSAGFQSVLITLQSPCTPSGGKPKGAVAGAMRATFCCK